MMTSLVAMNNDSQQRSSVDVNSSPKKDIGKDQLSVSLSKKRSTVRDKMSLKSNFDDLDFSENTTTTAALTSVMDDSLSLSINLMDHLSGSAWDHESIEVEREHHSSGAVHQTSTSPTSTRRKLKNNSDSSLFSRRRYQRQNNGSNADGSKTDREHDYKDTEKAVEGALDFDSILYGEKASLSSNRSSSDGLLRQYQKGRSSRDLNLEKALLEASSGEETDNTDDDCANYVEYDIDDNSLNGENKHDVNDLYDDEGQDGLEASISPWNDSQAFETTDTKDVHDSEDSQYVVDYGYDGSENGTSWCESQSSMRHEGVAGASQLRTDGEGYDSVKCLQLNIIPNDASVKLSKRGEHNNAVLHHEGKQTKMKPSKKKGKEKLASRDHLFSSSLLEDDQDVSGPIFAKAAASEPSMAVPSSNVSVGKKVSSSESELKGTSALKRHLQQNGSARSSGGSVSSRLLKTGTSSRNKMHSSSSSVVGRVQQRRILSAQSARNLCSNPDLTSSPRKIDKNVQHLDDNDPTESLEESQTKILQEPKTEIPQEPQTELLPEPRAGRKVKHIRTNRGHASAATCTRTIQKQPIMKTRAEHHQPGEAEQGVNGIVQKPQISKSSSTQLKSDLNSKQKSTRNVAVVPQNHESHSSLEASSSSLLKSPQRRRKQLGIMTDDSESNETYQSSKVSDSHVQFRTMPNFEGSHYHIDSLANNTHALSNQHERGSREREDRVELNFNLKDYLDEGMASSQSTLTDTPKQKSKLWGKIAGIRAISAGKKVEPNVVKKVETNDVLEEEVNIVPLTALKSISSGTYDYTSTSESSRQINSFR